MSGPVRWHARWVLPIAGPPIADGTVVTAGDRILWVGPRAEAPHGAPGGDARDEDLGDAILTPGLVNAHTHLDLTLMRGGLEDLDFFAWIRTLTRAKRQLLTAADLRDSALLGVAEGLAAGITTFGDTADNDAPFEALRALGARGIAFREVFGPDPAECDRSMADLAAAVEVLRAHATPLVRVGVSPHAPYSVSDALFAAVAAYAAREGLPVAVHAAESAAISKATLTGVVKTLEARGLISRRVSETDRRLVNLDLTAEGDALMRELYPLFNAAESEVVAGLSERSLKDLTRSLRSIVTELEALDSGTDAAED